MNDQKEIGEVLELFLAGGGASDVEVVTGRAFSGGQGHATAMKPPRLTLCLGGTRVYRTLRDEIPLEIIHTPGQGVFIAPEAWLTFVPRHAYRALAIVFYENYTRFALSEFDPNRDDLENYPSSSIRAHYHVPLGADALSQNLLAALCRNETKNSAAPTFFLNALLCCAAQILVSDASADIETSKAQSTYRYARDFVLENCDKPLSREAVAAWLRVHPNHVSRLFARFGGESFGAFLNRTRLERARILLADPKLNVSEVARLSGFSSANYFVRAFGRHFGMTPTRARAEKSGNVY